MIGPSSTWRSGPAYVVVNGPARPAPTHRSTGSKAVTKPPGAAFQVVLPSGGALQIDGQSIGYHHEVRVPEGLESQICASPASRGSHWLEFEARSNTEHGQEDPTLVGVVRICGDDSRLAWLAVLSASGSTSPIRRGQIW